MREIKLKAWDSVIKQMCVWKLHINPNIINDISYMWVGENGFVYPWEHPDLTKIQFTGLHDKNGKEIYEGDIVRILYTDWPSWNGKDFNSLDDYLDSISHVGEVAWDKHEGRFALKMKNTRYGGFYNASIHEGKHGRKAVIGNVFENPELTNKE